MSQEMMASFAPPRATVATNAGFQALQGRWLRLAYSHRVLVHKGPCVQAERMSFTSRYSYGYNVKPLAELLNIRQAEVRAFLALYQQFSHEPQSNCNLLFN